MCIICNLLSFCWGGDGAKSGCDARTGTVHRSLWLSHQNVGRTKDDQVKIKPVDFVLLRRTVFPCIHNPAN